MAWDIDQRWANRDTVTIIEADRYAVRQDERRETVGRLEVLRHHVRYNSYGINEAAGVSMAINNILSAGKVDEKRERLGRAAYEADMVKNIGGHIPGRHVPWNEAGGSRREEFKNIAAAVQAELAKMEEE